MNHEEDRARTRTPAQREVTKIAYRPSKRVRKLTSKTADQLSGYPDRLYRGEDLKRRPR